MTLRRLPEAVAQEIERLKLVRLQLSTQSPDKIWRHYPAQAPADKDPVWFVVNGNVCAGEFDHIRGEGSYFNSADGAWPASRISHWIPRYVEPKPEAP